MRSREYPQPIRMSATGSRGKLRSATRRSTTTPLSRSTSTLRARLARFIELLSLDALKLTSDAFTCLARRFLEHQSTKSHLQLWCNLNHGGVADDHACRSLHYCSLTSVTVTHQGRRANRYGTRSGANCSGGRPPLLTGR